MLSESYELLHGAYRAFTENEQKISETFDGLHRTLGASGDFLEKNGPRLTRVVENAETLSVEAQATLKAARERYVDGAQVTRIMNDVERSASVMSQNGFSGKQSMATAETPWRSTHSPTLGSR